MKIHVIGLGNFGSFLVRHFLNSGFQVTGWDSCPEKRRPWRLVWGHDWDKLHPVESNIAKDSDVVIVSLFPDQITRIDLEGVGLDALWVNVCSLQEPGLTALNSNGIHLDRVLSFHALFGPVSVEKSGWGGKLIIVTKKPFADIHFEMAELLMSSFTRNGVILDWMSPEEHDQKMLSHALAFLIAELVKVGTEGADPRFLTGSGRQMLGLLDFTEAGSQELRNLILSNPALKAVVPKLKKVLEELSKQHGW